MQLPGRKCIRPTFKNIWWCKRALLKTQMGLPLWNKGNKVFAIEKI